MDFNYKILFIGILILTASACGKKQSDDNRDEHTINDSILSTLPKTKAVKEEIRDEIRLNGRIVPDEAKQADVFALVSGRISNMKVESGDYVKKGMPLAVLHSTEVATIGNELEAAKANVAIARKNVETSKELFECGLATEREYATADAEYQKAISELETAKQIASITGGIQSAYTLIAPISGYIIAKNIHNNSEVRQDMAEPLFSIADLSTVWALADVYEVDIPSIRSGQTVRINTLADPNTIYTGKIDKIYSILDPETRTMKIRVSLDNKDKTLLPGMFVSINVNVNENRQSTAIPSSAVILDGNSKYVIVLKENDQPEIREIQEISRSGNRSYITGVQPEETVITGSHVFLYEALNIK